jgi:hypothetical protein
MKRFSRAGALGGLFVAVGILVPTAASAAECGTPAVDAVYETVVVPAVPAVYDTVTVLIEAEVPAQEAYDEQILVREAYTTNVEGSWWSFSPNESEGPFEGPPTFPEDPRGTWNGPKTEGGPGEDEVGVFQRGGNSGNGNWFYREADQVIEVPAEYTTVHHPAVPGKDAVWQTDEILVTPAVPESTKQVLVKEAVPAGPPCVEEPEEDVVVPVSLPDNDAPVAAPALKELAYTGSQDQKLLGLCAILIAGGLALNRLGKRINVTE